MSRLNFKGIAAALLVFGGSSQVTVAQTVKPPAPADEATPISCIIYMEYEGPTGEGSATVASNVDIAGSAVALSRKLPGEAPLQKVDHHLSIDDALRSFLAPKENGKRSKCCKRIDIFGHGSSLGELELPRTHPDDAPDQAGIEKIGGSQADDALPEPKYPKKEQTRLLEFIASLQAAACPDPVVHFQACYTVQGGSSGIATEIATYGGMTTTGYTGQVNFPREDKPDGDGHIWSPPEASDGSKEVTKEPPPPPAKEEVKKEERKNTVRKSASGQPKKGMRKAQTATSQQQASKGSGTGMSPEGAQTLGTVIGIGVGIGMGGRGRGDDGGGRMMRDR